MGLASAGVATRVGWSALVALGTLLAPERTGSEGGPVPTATEASLDAAPRPARWLAWTRAVAPVEVVSLGTGARAAIRLYGDDGNLRPEALARFAEVVGGGEGGPALSPRLVQLVVNASYRFSTARVLVVSGWRERAGRHSTGDALDFKLEGVPAGTLAASLRSIPRAGVGLYTHPRTQYVHLDLREPSYHWLDGSPPGVTWRERMLRDLEQVARDASWTPEADLP